MNRVAFRALIAEFLGTRANIGRNEWNSLTPIQQKEYCDGIPGLTVQNMDSLTLLMQNEEVGTTTFASLGEIIDLFDSHKFINIEDYGVHYIHDHPVQITCCELENNQGFQWFIQRSFSYDTEQLVSGFSEDKLDALDAALDSFCQRFIPYQTQIQYYFDSNEKGNFLALVPFSPNDVEIITQNIYEMIPNIPLGHHKVTNVAALLKLFPEYCPELIGSPHFVWSCGREVKFIDILSKYSSPWMPVENNNEIDSAILFYQRGKLGQWSNRYFNIDGDVIEVHKKDTENLTIVTPPGLDNHQLRPAIQNYLMNYGLNRAEFVVLCSQLGNQTKCEIYDEKANYFTTLLFDFQLHHVNVHQEYNNNDFHIMQRDTTDEQQVNIDTNQNVEYNQEEYNEIDDCEIGNKGGFTKKMCENLETAICIVSYLVNPFHSSSAGPKEKKWELNSKLNFSIHYGGPFAKFQMRINDVPINTGLKAISKFDQGNEFESAVLMTEQIVDFLPEEITEKVIESINGVIGEYVELETLCTIIKFLCALLG